MCSIDTTTNRVYLNDILLDINVKENSSLKVLPYWAALPSTAATKKEPAPIHREARRTTEQDCVTVSKLLIPSKIKAWGKNLYLIDGVLITLMRKVEFSGSAPAFLWRESRKPFRKTTLGTPDLDSNPNLPVIGRTVNKLDVLDTGAGAATEA
ncbi:unnamed protein product, partial [Timema podura]|nr:unnamed protein product [Timema podura]